jgi:hypothetical protein
VNAHVDPEDLWFQGLTPPTGRLGNLPNPTLRYLAHPDDGIHVWAVGTQPVARQQLEWPEEFATMPDHLLHGEGYRLRELAAIRLPAEFAAVLESGPRELNHRFPLVPTAMTICGELIMAVSRHFPGISAHVALLPTHWILAICPPGARPTLDVS